jgi:hypothetical protein
MAVVYGTLRTIGFYMHRRGINIAGRGIMKRAADCQVDIPVLLAELISTRCYLGQELAEQDPSRS